MSRSYKQHPYSTYSKPGSKRWCKNKANRKVRRSNDEITDCSHSQYKKLYDSRMISDETCQPSTYKNYRNFVLGMWSDNKKTRKGAKKNPPSEKEIQRSYYKIFRNK